MPLEMDEAIRARWTAKLRSGEIPQTDGALRQGDARCCLGVLCDIAVTDGIIAPPTWCEDPGVWDYDGNWQLLPDSILAWADFNMHEVDGGDPTVSVSDPTLPGVSSRGLAELNDDGWTFAQIADAIDGGEGE